MFMASYTFTDATDNFSTLRVPPPAGETSFLFNNQPELDIGRSLNTPEQVFVIKAASTSCRPRSGSPASSGRRRAARSMPRGCRRIPTATSSSTTVSSARRKAGTLRTRSTRDLRVAKDFGSGVRRFTAMVEIFNLFNRANPFIVNTIVGPDVGQTIQPLPGREIQIGVRFELKSVYPHLMYLMIRADLSDQVNTFHR